MLNLGLILLIYWDFVLLSIYNGQLGGGHGGEAIVGLFHVIAKAMHKFSMWNGHVVEVGGRGEGVVWHGHVLGDNCYWCLIKKKINKKKVKYLLIFSIWIGLWFIHKWTINIQDCCGSSRMFSYCSQHSYCRQTFFGEVGARFKSTNSIKPTKINIYLYLNFRLGYDCDRIAYPT